MVACMDECLSKMMFVPARRSEMRRSRVTHHFQMLIFQLWMEATRASHRLPQLFPEQSAQHLARPAQLTYILNLNFPPHLALIMAPSADLVLPPPTNEPSTPNGANPKAARVEEVQDSATTGASATTAAADAAPTAQRFATGGIIYPPPDIRGIVDKTAAFVARTGTQFEARIRAEEKGNSKFAFLNESDPYHAYYRSKIEAVKSGEAAAPGTPGAGDGAKEGIVARMDGKEAADEERVKEEEGKPEEPPVFEFSADLPNITAVDL